MANLQNPCHTINRVTERKDVWDKSPVMKLNAKRRGQYVMKREQRGLFKISSRTKIKPKDDVICRIAESISATERSQSLNQPGSTQRRPCPPSYAISPTPNSPFSPCVCVSVRVCVGNVRLKGLRKALMPLSSWRVAVHYQSAALQSVRPNETWNNACWEGRVSTCWSRPVPTKTDVKYNLEAIVVQCNITRQQGKMFWFPFVARLMLTNHVGAIIGRWTVCVESKRGGAP